MFVSILTRLRAILQRRRVARELDDELQFHVAMETETNIKKGMPPIEARRTALRDLGGLEQTKETVRDVRAFSVEGIWKDMRYALRSLSTVPGWPNPTSVRRTFPSARLRIRLASWRTSQASFAP